MHTYKHCLIIHTCGFPCICMYVCMRFQSTLLRSFRLRKSREFEWERNGRDRIYINGDGLQRLLWKNRSQIYLSVSFFFFFFCLSVVLSDFVRFRMIIPTFSFDSSWNTFDFIVLCLLSRFLFLYFFLNRAIVNNYCLLTVFCLLLELMELIGLVSFCF